MKIEGDVLKMLGLEDALSGEIVIPEGVSYFTADVFREQPVKSVVIPSSVKEIPSYAFYKCRNLEKVTILGDVKIIDRATFHGCEALKQIDLPKSVKSIDENAFSYSGITSINLTNVETIKSGAFSGCHGLKTVKCANEMNQIANSAFLNCGGLEEVQLPTKLHNGVIAENLFKGCKNLKSVKMPNNVLLIDEGAFSGCKNLSEFKIPEGTTVIGENAFAGCDSLKSITIPNSVKGIQQRAFTDCGKLSELVIPNSVTEIGAYAFSGTSLQQIKLPFNAEFSSHVVGYVDGFKFIYFDPNRQFITFSKNEDENLKKTCYMKKNSGEYVMYDENFKANNVRVMELQQQGKASFLPPDFILKIMPTSQIDNFFENRNYIRWRNIVKQCQFDKLTGIERLNSLTDLFKVYYSLGGFSDNQGKSEEAADYVLSYILNPLDKNYDYKECANKVHKQFSGLVLNGKFNPDFAEFFMMYYKDNPNFLDLELEGAVTTSYLVPAHNMFDKILQENPNKRVKTRKDNDRLTPELIIKYLSNLTYQNVEEGNEILATIVGSKGYTQVQFEQIQQIFNKAKQIKDSFLLCADKSVEQGCVKFRLLEKDDPLGFIIGDLTNCCQHIGGRAESCVDDGYTNPNAGFLVFEESILDENGNPTNKTRILGQSYVWYDKETKTVCYDNIEIPDSVVQELGKGTSTIKSEDLIKAVELSAEAILTEMRKRGVDVERVTVGKSYNDLNNQLKSRYELEENPKAKNKVGVYSDAKDGQYIIKEIEQRKQDKKSVQKSLFDFKNFK